MTPKRIILVALIFAIRGASAVWEVVTALMDGTLDLNFEVLLLPIAYGLLLGKSIARFGAEIFIVIEYFALAFAFFIGLHVSTDDTFSTTFFGAQITLEHVQGLFLITLLGLGAVNLCLHALIRSRKARLYCSQQSQSAPTKAPEPPLSFRESIS
jgi:hypothetical protein